MKLKWDKTKMLKKIQESQRCLRKKHELMNKFDENRKNIDPDIVYNSFYKLHHLS